MIFTMGALGEARPVGAPVTWCGACAGAALDEPHSIS
eukprot:CAMPEP_0117679886 /NCGR_PEP_ID=MMETSP0804-20121206/18046_1 /TAXON_ID=1074897 /ORGANISM="Tetraselmis astigmatica, Strain CCMP880" /LENGTH=36 /DNA_ID= /DNA_START= /DNA_END= /DNA_ORIENTATION=